MYMYLFTGTGGKTDNEEKKCVFNGKHVNLWLVNFSLVS